MVGQLRITQTNMKIDYNIRDLQLDYSQPLPRMDVTRIRGEVDAQSQPSHLIVDQSACFAQEGLKTSAMLSREFAQQGLDDIRKYTEQSSVEGRQILDRVLFDKKIFAKIASSKTIKEPAQTVLTFIPSQPPDISFTDPVHRYEITPDRIQLNWNVSQQPNYTVVQEPKVEYYATQYPEIHFEYVEAPRLDTRA